MRVLHVVESFSTGVFTVVQQICQRLVADGVPVAVAFSIRPETPHDYERSFRGVELFRVDMVREVAPLTDLRALGQVIRVMRRFRPDIVHAHSSKGGVVGRCAALGYRALGGRARVFFSPHGFSFLREDLPPRTRRLFLWFERIAYLCGGTIMCCSEGEAAVARRCIGRRVGMVENGIDLTHITPDPSAVSGRKLRVATVGRISAQKNPELFAAVASGVRSDQVEFVWIGGGSPEDERDLGRVPGVTVTGWLPRDEALAHLMKADIYLQTSRWEGMPISVLEAMAAGLPVVATDVVGNRDAVVVGKTGYLASSADELIKHLAKLAADPALRSTLGANARRTALERFSLARFLSDWMKVYAPPHTTDTGDGPRA